MMHTVRIAFFPKKSAGIYETIDSSPERLICTNNSPAYAALAENVKNTLVENGYSVDCLATECLYTKDI